MKTTRRQAIASTAAIAAAGSIVPLTTRAAAQDTTTITWWHITTQEDQQALMTAAADAYMAKNPGVEIEITVLENEAFKQKLATAMQSGDPPDIFQSWGGGVLYQYAEAELVRDITADLTEDGWSESFLASPLALYARDGKNYGVPWRTGMIGVWYRKSLFEQAGIETNPTTWDEFLETVQTLKDAGITPISLGEGDKWPGHFYWSYLAIREGGQDAFEAAYSGDGSFADEPFVKAGEDLAQLVELEPFQSGFLAATYPDSSQVFADAGAAMEVMGHWSPGNMDALAEDPAAMRADLGWFPFPAVEGGAGAPTDVLGGGDGFALGVNASDQAVDFVRYMTSLDVQSAWAAEGFAVPPVVKGAEEAVTDENIIPVMEALAEATYFQLYYDQFLPPAVGGVVLDETQLLIAGQQTPEGVAEAVEASFESEMGS
jgi:raffinose/stachyose/melibiose transport system substrate-binding protein